MELLNNSIGISDLLAHRDCPRRMSYGMKRHTGIGRQSDDQTPEAGSYATDYGSAIHAVLQHLEDAMAAEDAIQSAWNVWGHRLNPSDVDLLRDDVRTYLARDHPNTRLVASEDEFRVPLFVHPDIGQVYFRFKLDRLYERLDAPGVFIHKDYKSSRWAKSPQEVAEDLQMWAYNFGIHEFWPECRNLIQIYDQLRYGTIPTRKTDKQREQIKDWLIKATTAVIDDVDVRDDDLLRPRFNQWCAWCPIMESCPVVEELSDFARVEIESLAPAEKVGRKTVVKLDDHPAHVYIERMADAKAAIVVLERFVESVKELLRAMPAADRVSAGYDFKQRKSTSFPVEAKEALHDRLGPAFYELVKVTKTGLESYLGDDPETLEWALEQALEEAGAEVLTAV